MLSREHGRLSHMPERLFEVVKVFGCFAEVFIDFAGNGLVFYQFKRGGLAVFVKLRDLKRDNLTRRAGGRVLRHREEKAVSTTLVQNKTQKLKLYQLAFLVLERQRDALFCRRARLNLNTWRNTRSSSVSHHLYACCLHAR